jgi:integrase
MSLSLPIYLIGSSYYIHTRIGGKQLKRSLRTAYKREAIIKAISLLHSMTKDLPQKYELDLSRGILKSDGPEDHTRLLQAMEAMKAIHVGQGTTVASNTVTAPSIDDPTALKLGELLEKFFLLKKVQPATVKGYSNATKEFSQFLKNPPITRIQKSDITRWMEHLAEIKKNEARTIDTKVGVIKTLLNFAKRQSYTRNDNPAENMNLLTKKQKEKNGWAIFEREELDLLLRSEFFKLRKTTAPNYVCCVILCLFTGCRIGEITNLKKDQFKTSPKGTPFFKIRDSKTVAGIREVPLHPFIHNYMTEFMNNKPHKIFEYKERDGKGSGNAVGKMFAENLKSANLTREKLVFHSLRKYVNNTLLQNNVSIEHRCQFVGHELNNVNVNVYSKTVSVDDLAKTIFPALDEIKALVLNTSAEDIANLGDLLEGTLI